MTPHHLNRCNTYYLSIFCNLVFPDGQARGEKLLVYLFRDAAYASLCARELV